MKLSRNKIRRIVESVINEDKDESESLEKNIKDAIKSLDPQALVALTPVGYGMIMYYHHDDIIGEFEKNGSKAAAEKFLFHYNQLFDSIEKDPFFTDISKNLKKA
jgi:hypothetical protein